jgi:FkbM family methyltransferase
MIKSTLSKIKNRLEWRVLTRKVEKISSSFQPSNSKKGLFIDGGSNLGQGYTYFKKYFPIEKFDALLIEPNPNCMKVVQDKFKDIENIDFIQKAIWTKEDKLNFFGLVEDDRGNTSTGGSVVESHASSWYASDKEQALEVDAFSFSNLLKEKSQKYDTIIVKMDIESAEYEVLKDLIEKDSITCIDHLFVEFHSQYFDDSERSTYQQTEKDLIETIESKGVGLTLWI